jgi:hypothetical protein
MLDDSEVGPDAKDDVPRRAGGKPDDGAGGAGGGSGGGSAGGSTGGGPPGDGEPGGTSVGFEAESLAFVDSGTGTTVDTDVNASGGRWVSLAAENTGSWMEFTMPGVRAGAYTLSLTWKGNGNRGVATLRVDGVVVGDLIDQYSDDQSYPSATVGKVTFASAGSHVVRLQVSGQNPASSGFVLSADRF